MTTFLYKITFEIKNKTNKHLHFEIPQLMIKSRVLHFIFNIVYSFHITNKLSIVTLEFVYLFVWICMKKESIGSHQFSQDWIIFYLLNTMIVFELFKHLLFGTVLDVFAVMSPRIFVPWLYVLVFNSMTVVLCDPVILTYNEIFLVSRMGLLWPS